MRGKGLGGCAYDTVKHFCLTNEYTELRLAVRSRCSGLGKENDEFRALNSPLKCCVNDLNTSLYLEISETKPQILSSEWKWLNYDEN
jgi:hypothetical protein